MLSLALAVVAIALPDCVNPSLIGGELFFVSGRHPARQTIAFAMVTFLVTFMVGCALALGLGDLILSFVPKPGATVKYALITVAGIALSLGGALLWIRRKTMASSTGHRGRDRGLGSAVAMGAGLSGLELLTAFPFFAAIAMIGGSSESNLSKGLLLALYCVVYTAPLTAIAIACAVLGEGAEAVLRPITEWLMTHWPTFVAPVAMVCGIGLVAYGIVRLAST